MNPRKLLQDVTLGATVVCAIIFVVCILAAPTWAADSAAVLTVVSAIVALIVLVVTGAQPPTGFS